MVILADQHGRTFLTDPWFSTRPGYYQGEPIAAGIGDLPALDGVLITHAHYDHCDLQAFAAYRDRDVPLFVAATVTGKARKHGFGNVTPLEPWQHAEADGVSITAAPAKHGPRSPTCSDRDLTPSTSPATPCSSPNDSATSASPCSRSTACRSGPPATCRS